jgi:hypothetical protein
VGISIFDVNFKFGGPFLNWKVVTISNFGFGSFLGTPVQNFYIILIRCFPTLPKKWLYSNGLARNKKKWVGNLYLSIKD